VDKKMNNDIAQDKKLIKKAFSLHDNQQHKDKKTNLSKLKSGGGLYANLHAKQQRIANGSKERMRKPGSEGAPSAQDFKASAKTAKKKNGGGVQNP